ncbi:MAG: group III truncated hemoglobin, partial [Chryseosolibacter sp.]
MHTPANYIRLELQSGYEQRVPAMNGILRQGSNFKQFYLLTGIMKHDIINREDIKLLVDSFYEKVQADALLAPVFNHVDWPHHLPIMYNFWSSMLLGDQSYRGN